MIKTWKIEGKLEEQFKRSNNCIIRVPERKNEENKREEIMWVGVIVVFSQKNFPEWKETGQLMKKKM